MAYGDGANLEGPEEDRIGQRAQKLAEAGRLPAPRIYHACGTERFPAGKRPGHRGISSPAIPGNPFDYTYEEDPGAHTWEFWDEHIQHFLRFIGLKPVAGVRN